MPPKTDASTYKMIAKVEVYWTLLTTKKNNIMRIQKKNYT